jgi:exodeoxyribonuclease V alpha subunit
MQNKNNYDILWKQEGETGQGIFNGDIGRITMIDKARHVAVIDFDGRVAVYPFALLSQIELAYAVTVHKSQGSEFEVVIMPVLDQYKKLCDRSLLYTGVTRAKKLLILVGSVRELTEMTANVRKNIRYTCLRKMLEEGTDAVEFEAGQFLAD